LQNIIERAVALAESDTLTLADLPPDLQEYAIVPNGRWSTLEEAEREHIRKVLSFTNHHLAESARILALPRTTLWRKLKKYGLSKSSQSIPPCNLSTPSRCETGFICVS
jgi:transcriptional regulator of acetoin/glycerol metabolism